MRQFKSLTVILIFIVTLIASCTLSQPSQLSNNSTSDATSATTVETVEEPQSQLEAIRDRGYLICGVNGSLPGLSFLDKESNRYSGIDVDICRAVAAALFDDPEKVEYRAVNSSERFPALEFGEIDLLSRDTTWTLERDSAHNIEFTPTILYDGQSIMVRADSGITRLEDFSGRSICVETGTTTFLNLEDKMRELDVEYDRLEYTNTENTYDGYLQGKCSGVTSDKVQLAARRSTMTGEHIILETLFSKEPLGPAVVSDDPQWFDVVKWVTYTLIEAEELGIGQSNLDQFQSSTQPQVRRFLGLEGDLGASLGLVPEFTQRIVKHVGNYKEIYERNLNTILPERGLNKLWKDGGLLYSPPFR
ncbi:MAG: amino acid ABC transporter substrate-binding protein [Microcoleaceae cyanobacterium]